MIRIDLPWVKPPLSQNDRGINPHVKAAKVAQALTEARWSIRAAKVRPVVSANVTLHYRVPDRRRRDADNLAATFKVCQDALVAEGVLPEDSWVCVPRAAQEIHAPSKEGPSMWLELEVITRFEEAAKVTRIHPERDDVRAKLKADQEAYQAQVRALRDAKTEEVQR